MSFRTLFATALKAFSMTRFLRQAAKAELAARGAGQVFVDCWICCKCLNDLKRFLAWAMNGNDSKRWCRGLRVLNSLHCALSFSESMAILFIYFTFHIFITAQTTILRWSVAIKSTLFTKLRPNFAAHRRSSDLWNWNWRQRAACGDPSWGATAVKSGLHGCICVLD